MSIQPMMFIRPQLVPQQPVEWELPETKVIPNSVCPRIPLDTSVPDDKCVL